MFIILASTFMAVSANNILTVISGTDYYPDKAGIGDYIAVTQGENGNIDNILENCGVDYSCENVIYSDKGNVKVNGGKFESGRNNMIILMPMKEAKLTYFGIDNEPIKSLIPTSIAIYPNM